MNDMHIRQEKLKKERDEGLTKYQEDCQKMSSELKKGIAQAKKAREDVEIHWCNLMYKVLDLFVLNVLPRSLLLWANGLVLIPILNILQNHNFLEPVQPSLPYDGKKLLSLVSFFCNYHGVETSFHPKRSIHNPEDGLLLIQTISNALLLVD